MLVTKQNWSEDDKTFLVGDLKVLRIVERLGGWKARNKELRLKRGELSTEPQTQILFQDTMWEQVESMNKYNYVWYL